MSTLQENSSLDARTIHSSGCIYRNNQEAGGTLLINSAKSENKLVIKKDNDVPSGFSASLIRKCEDFKNDFITTKNEEITYLVPKTEIQDQVLDENSDKKGESINEDFIKCDTSYQEKPCLVSKIEVEEPRLLKEEPSEYRKNISQNINKEQRKQTSKFIKNLKILCDLCDDKTACRVIQLNKQEQFAAAVALKKSLSLGLRPKKIFCRKIPQQSCGRCFTKIILFSTHLKKKRLQRDIRIEPQMEPSYPHGYNCACISCQNRYGQLHLIVRGIETTENVVEEQPQRHGAAQVRTLGSIREEQHFQHSRPHTFQPERALGEEGLYFPRSPSVETPPPISTIPYMKQETQGSSHGSYQDFESACSSFASESLWNRPLNPPFGGHYSGSQSQFSTQTTKTEPTSESSSSPSSSQFGSNTRQSDLPTMLQEFEECEQDDRLSQPSSSGTSSSPPKILEDPKSKKTKRVCSHCQKQFNHTGDFRKHLRKHTKERPYACKQCDKRFSHTSNLHRHERSHTGDRPFKCEFCGKEFNRKDKLESHKKSILCKRKRKTDV